MAERAELEQNVAWVLRGHPGGISLFRFRQAYGAAYTHPFPLDSTASVKEQLAAMPGVVRVEGWGVQTMLFPVCPQELPSEETGTCWESGGVGGEGPSQRSNLGSEGLCSLSYESEEESQPVGQAGLERDGAKQGQGAWAAGSRGLSRGR